MLEHGGLREAVATTGTDQKHRAMHGAFFANQPMKIHGLVIVDRSKISLNYNLTRSITL